MIQNAVRFKKNIFTDDIVALDGSVGYKFYNIYKNLLRDMRQYFQHEFNQFKDHHDI